MNLAYRLDPVVENARIERSEAIDLAARYASGPDADNAVKLAIFMAPPKRIIELALRRAGREHFGVLNFENWLR